MGVVLGANKPNMVHRLLLQFSLVSGATNRWARERLCPLASGLPSMPEIVRHRGIGSNPMPHFYSSRRAPTAFPKHHHRDQEISIMSSDTLPKRILTVSLILFLCVPPALAKQVFGKVISVADGDTITVLGLRC